MTWRDGKKYQCKRDSEIIQSKTVWNCEGKLITNFIPKLGSFYYKKYNTGGGLPFSGWIYTKDKKNRYEFINNRDTYLADEGCSAIGKDQLRYYHKEQMSYYLRNNPKISFTLYFEGHKQTKVSKISY